MKRNNRYFWLVVIIVIFCFVPVVPISVVPSIRLQVVDEQGNPLPEMVIEQSWRHNTYQFFDGVSQVRSDNEGVAEFPERVEYFSFAQILFGEAFRAAPIINHHAGFGPSSLFLPRGNVSGLESYSPGEPLPTTMVVKH